jgi:SNF2 family DNA or RNA helicase
MRIEKLLSGNGKNRIDQAVELTPSLVICPAALVYHWTGEIKSYFSDCSLLHEVMICEGNNWKINFNAATTALLIVSYDTLRRNMEFFQSRVWEMIILDEAHLIRNPKTILSKSVFQLKSEYRLALTGTPIQNKVIMLDNF